MKGEILHIIAVQTEITPSYLDNFLPVLRRQGKKIGEIKEFILGEHDFRSYLLKIKQRAPTDILLITLSNASAVALKQSHDLNVKAQFYTLGVESPALIELAGELAEGILYPYSYDNSSNQRAVSQFKERYRSTYGEFPDAVAANSFDAAMLLSNCFETHGTKTAEVKKCLYQTTNYTGASGTFSIDKNGDAVKDLIIKTIRNGKFVLYGDN